jgi:hypothetical protein
VSAKTATAPAATEGATVRRVLQRVVLPADRDTDVLPLYVDPDRAQLDVDKSGLTPAQRAKVPPPEPVADIEPDPHAVLGRYRYEVPKNHRISFGTYFNGFAASYWRRWTIVEDVSLHVRLTGDDASVIVYRSMPNGRAQRVESAGTSGDWSRPAPPATVPRTSASTCPSPPSVTAAGTGSTSWPAPPAPSSRRRPGSRTSPRTAPTPARSPSASPR